MSDSLLRPSINATLPPSGGEVVQEETKTIESLDTSTTEPLATESEVDPDLAELVDSLPDDEPATTEPEDVTSKFDTPEFQDFNTKFKDTVGVDLKEAYNSFLEIQKQNQELRQQLEQQQAQVM